MNAVYMILFIIGGGIGVLCSLYLALAIPAIIVWKLYRKIRYGKSLYA